jgi:hypothetical protein
MSERNGWSSVARCRKSAIASQRPNSTHLMLVTVPRCTTNKLATMLGRYIKDYRREGFTLLEGLAIDRIMLAAHERTIAGSPQE